MIDPLQTHLPEASAAIDPPQKPQRFFSSAKATAVIDPLQKPLRRSILCKSRCRDRSSARCRDQSSIDPRSILCLRPSLSLIHIKSK